jgi:hypothetical protein
MLQSDFVSIEAVRQRSCRVCDFGAVVVFSVSYSLRNGVASDSDTIFTGAPKCSGAIQYCTCYEHRTCRTTIHSGCRVQINCRPIYAVLTHEGM